MILKLQILDSNELNAEKLKFFNERTSRHISLVKDFANKIEGMFPELHGVSAQAAQHDASKYSEPELTPYIELTWNKRNGGNNILPKNIKRDINIATVMHITTNRHHPEYHDSISPDSEILNQTDRDKPPKKVINATKMSDIDIAEMCADWLAMSNELGTSVLDWANNNINKRWKFSDKQCDLIYRILNAFNASKKLRIVFERFNPEDIYDITYLNHLIGSGQSGSLYLPFVIEFINNKKVKYLNEFHPLIYKQLKKYDDRRRVDSDFVLPKYTRSISFSTLLNLIKKTYRSDMIRRNVVWEKLVQYLTFLEEIRASKQNINEILEKFDAIHNCIHNTKTSIFDKFDNSDELLIALNRCSTAKDPRILKQFVSSGFNDLIVEKTEKHNVFN